MIRISIPKLDYLVPPSKMEDSWPTLSSNSHLSERQHPKTPLLQHKHCFYADDEYLDDNDKAKEIIGWLKLHKGVRLGYPDKILQAHRQKQKSVITQKAGRSAITCKIGSSSLLARRGGKKIPSDSPQ